MFDPNNPFEQVDVRNIAARPQRFYEVPKRGEDGQIRMVEMIDWAPMGRMNASVTTQRVSEVQNGPLWQIFEPAYEAWKKGNAFPTTGTPLSAWSGLSPEQAEVIKMTGIRTVDELANVTSSIASKIQLPNIDNIIHSAKLFLESKDANAFAASLEAKEAELNAAIERMQEMERRMSAMMAARDADDDESPDKPKRHRRTKAEMEAARAVEAGQEFQPTEVDIG